MCFACYACILRVMRVSCVLCVCFAWSARVCARVLDVCTCVGMCCANVLRESLRVAIRLCYGGYACFLCAFVFGECFACVSRVMREIRMMGMCARVWNVHTCF